MKDMQMILKRMQFLPLQEAVKPSDYATVLLDRWWVVHPSNALMFFSRSFSPQCNSDVRITQRIASMYPPDYRIEYLSIVYVPTRLQSHDYA